MTAKQQHQGTPTYMKNDYFCMSLIFLKLISHSKTRIENTLSQIRAPLQMIYKYIYKYKIIASH